MFGPYDRTAYDRGGLSSSLYSQTLTATFEMVGDLSATLVYLLTLAGTYVMQGYRLKPRVEKLLAATYEVSGSFTRTIGKVLSSTFEMTGDLSVIKDFKRTLSATYVAAGTLTKRMYVTLAGTIEWIASRLKSEHEYGWEYTGDFAPGDRIIISSDLLTVTLNGSNVMHLVTGDLPFFEPGSNTLTYEDSEGTRQIKIRVYWHGRWI